MAAPEFELIERISCAGVDVQVHGQTRKRLDRLFESLGGQVGWVADKAVQLYFPNRDAMLAYQREASQLGVIFD